MSGEKCWVLHYHEVSEEWKKQMLFSDGKDIFNDTINNFSRLIINKQSFQPIDIPTIPLENIIIIEDKGIIIGLTRIISSPYLVVIYDLNGKLLYKGNLGISTLKLGKAQLKELINRYPAVLNIADDCDCFNEADTFYVSLSRGMINIIGRDNIRKDYSQELIMGHYMPCQISIDGGGIYKKYPGFYRYSDPLADIIMIGAVPYLLILNTEDGKQVHIPLISNCDLRNMSKSP